MEKKGTRNKLVHALKSKQMNCQVTEIDDHWSEVMVHHDVSRFQIAVGDGFRKTRVHGVHSVAYLPKR
jgi:hypothetical protein